MLFMVYLTVVANYFHPSNHCSDCEESEYLCSHDTDCENLLAVDIADAAEDAFGRCATSGRAGARHDCAWVARGINDGLGVGLEL